MRVIPRAALGLLFAIASVIAAHAHASLVKANPPVGSTVDAAPDQVVLTFTEKLEPAFSKVTVTDTNGAEVSQGAAQVNEAIMRIGLKSLSSGTYRERSRETPTKSKAALHSELTLAEAATTKQGHNRPVPSEPRFSTNIC